MGVNVFGILTDSSNCNTFYLNLSMILLISCSFFLSDSFLFSSEFFLHVTHFKSHTSYPMLIFKTKLTYLWVLDHRYCERTNFRNSCWLTFTWNHLMVTNWSQVHKKNNCGNKHKKMQIDIKNLFTVQE